MSEPVAISAGIAARYAAAVFDLVREEGALDALGTDLDALEGALAASPELRAMTTSPILSRAEERAGIDAVAARLGLSQTLRNTLSLMAEKRRLFVLPQLLRALRDRIAEEKGEVTAEVTSARALTAAQSKRLAGALHDATGKDVKLNATVDESLIGGLVVKVGSRMIDGSIRSKLANLKNAMKEVR